MAAAFLAAPVQARDYYFFNKPGVDRQAYLDDRLACDELSGAARRIEPDKTQMYTQLYQNRNLTTGQTAAAAGISSFLLSFMAAREQRHLGWQIERICLADKGYRRFEIDKAEFKAIEADGDEAARIEKWFALAASATPQGKEMHE